MPELPEVETTRRGIEPHILGKTVSQVCIRHPRLRWPIPEHLPASLPGQRLRSLHRRGKYLLLEFATGHLLLHLGMSGNLRILKPGAAAQKHDHFDVVFSDCLLRLNDPRRFGAVLWTTDNPGQHPLLRHLGPEPLSDAFHAAYLKQRARQRHTAIKNFIMDSTVVVGVGNIYANEALFLAGIAPGRSCRRISLQRYARLTDSIKSVLAQAIQQGGTTLNDFLQADGQPGYFAQQLQVYGRAGQPCLTCGATLKQRVIGQRSSFYCSRCQR